MAQQVLKLKASGIFTYPSQFTAPNGSMLQATDVFIDRPDTIESRRSWLTDIAQEVGYYCGALTAVNGNLIAAFSPTPFTTVAQIYGYNSGAWQALFGNYNIQGGLQNQNVTLTNADIKLDCFTYNGLNYLCTSLGTVRWDGTLNRPRRYPCGLPQPSDFIINYTGGPGNIAANSARAYRAIFLTKINNNQFVRSPPSARVIAYNNTTTQYSTTVQMNLPGTGLFAGDLVQIYASETQGPLTSTAIPAVPSDELQLVAEYVIQPGDITATTPYPISIDCWCPDSARGAYLYTNPNTGQGPLQAENNPPAATCTAIFQGTAFYANTSAQYQIVGTLLDVSQWTTSTTVTLTYGVNSYTVSFVAPSYIYQCGELASFTGIGTGTVYLGSLGPSNDYLSRIMASMCRIWSYQNPNIQALMVSESDYPYDYTGALGTNTLPLSNLPQFLIQTMGQGTDAVAPVLSITNGPASASFSLALPYTGINNPLQHGIFFSKPQQPEAVPVNNYFTVGSSSYPILWIMPLRNSLFIGKQDGLYRLTGTTAQSITIELFDPTFEGTQMNSVASAGNQIFAACTQGIVSITESGMQVISRQIEDQILQFVGVGSNINTVYNFYATASDTEHKYMWCANSGVGNLGSGSNGIWVYNFINGMWTNLSVRLTGGAQDTTVGGLASGTIGSFTDRIYIGAINNGTYQIFDMQPTNAPPLGYGGLSSTASVTWVAFVGDAPTTKKRFLEAIAVTAGGTYSSTLKFTFSTETSTTPETVTVTPNAYGAVRVIVPQAMQYCTLLYLTISGNYNSTDYIKITGVSLVYETVTTHVSR